MTQPFPPPDATREQIDAWRREQAAKYNAAIDTVSANVDAGRSAWSQIDPVTRRWIEANERTHQAAKRSRCKRSA